MREIKFRVWNSRIEKFVVFCNGEYYKKLDYDLLHRCSENLFDWSNAEQYTGKKDKNKKEIYEGDLFEAGGGYDCKYMVVIFDEEKSLYRFQAVGGEFDSEYLDELCMFNLFNMQIIGNIHENKELIK